MTDFVSSHILSQIVNDLRWLNRLDLLFSLCSCYYSLRFEPSIIFITNTWHVCNNHII